MCVTLYSEDCKPETDVVYNVTTFKIKIFQLFVQMLHNIDIYIMVRKQKSRTDAGFGYTIMHFKKGMYDLSIGTIKEEWTIAPHYQDGIELLFTSGVEGTALIGGHTYRADDQNIFCVGPDRIHGYQLRPAGAGKTWVLAINAKFISDALVACDRKNAHWLQKQFQHTPILTGTTAGQIRQATQRLSLYHLATSKSEPPLDNGRAAMSDLRYIFQIMSLILGEENIHSTDSSQAQERMRTILDMIERNASKAITLDDIAKSCAMTTCHLCRVFKKHTGMTVVDHINRLRVERAKRMLVSGEKKASVIAENCGFSSLSYFIRVFAKYAKTTPKQWVLSQRWD